MFVIRNDQLAVFRSHLEDEANKALLRYAKKRFPDCYNDGDDSKNLKQIEGIRKRAIGYGIEREDNVATFLDLTVMYGEEFHQTLWAKDIVQSKVLHGPDKIALLRHLVKETGVDL